VDRQAGDALALAHRQDDEVQQHAAMHAREDVGLDDERAALAFLEPGEGGFARGRRDHRLVAQRADAQPLFRGADPAAQFMADLGEMAREEPAQQRSAFIVGDGIGVGRHGFLHARPVAHGDANVGQRVFQRLFERAAGLCVGPVGLDIDHRFPQCAGRIIVQDRGQGAISAARYRQDGVQQPVDADVGRRERGGDRIDQEGHVVIDQRDPHEAAGGAFAQRLDRDTGLAGLARIGGATEEGRGGGDGRLIKSLALAGQGALCQDAFQRRANS